MSRLSNFLINFLVIGCLFYVTHYSSTAKKYDFSGTEQNLKGVHADWKYYLSGALSLSANTKAEKYNDRIDPFAASSLVNEADFSTKNQFIDFLYPYPSFKFGYSILIKLISSLKDETAFETESRVNFVNQIIVFLTSVTLYFLFKALIQRPGIKTSALSFFGVLFIILDSFFQSTAFSYLSHTMAGILFFSIGLLILFHKKPFSLNFTFGITLALSLLSSSHVFVGTVMMGVFSCYLVLIEDGLQNSILKKSRSFLLFFLGLFSPIFYIVFVEYYYDFKSLGLNTFFDSQIHYATVVNSLLGTYQNFKKMLPPAAWEPFYIAFFAYFAFSAVYFFKAQLLDLKYSYRLQLTTPKLLKHNDLCISHKNNSILNFSKISLTLLAISFRALANFIRMSSKTPLILIFMNLILLVTFFWNAFFSQPIVRGDAPFYFFFNLTLFMYFILATNNGKKVFLFVFPILFLVRLSSFSVEFMFEKRLLTAPVTLSLNPISCNKLTLKEDKILWEEVREFHSVMGEIVLPQGAFGKFSLSLAPSNSNKILSDLPNDSYFCFDPMEFVNKYSHTRRFIGRFQPEPLNIVSVETVKKDFNLIFELLEREVCTSRKFVESQKVYRRSNMVYDQEYNTIYGLSNKFTQYLEPKYNINMNKIYLFDRQILNTKCDL